MKNLPKKNVLIPWKAKILRKLFQALCSTFQALCWFAALYAPRQMFHENFFAWNEQSKSLEKLKVLSSEKWRIKMFFKRY